jgi:phosphate-selective porin
VKTIIHIICRTDLLLAGVFLFLLSNVSLSQTRVSWGGYLQTRFSDDFRSNSGFSIRRAKLWIDGPAPDVTNLTFRMQGIFRYQTSGTLMLQDVYGEYKLPFGFVRAGQFVPDFALERQQGDAFIPLIERAAVVNSLIPSGDTYARDVGAEFVLEPKGSGFHTSFGIYNGNGGNTKSNEDRQFLYTNRTTYDIQFSDAVSWISGFSVAYRDKKDLSFPSILGSGKTFSGKDFRWGLETHFKLKSWELQAEYIQADLENHKSYGYYVFGDYDFDNLNEVVLSTEKLVVVNPAYPSDPWYIVGYSHFFNGQKFKVMVDAREQSVSDRTNYGGTVQLQIFFN